MKKILWISLLMPVLAMAGINLGIKKQDEYISYAVFCVDSAGVDRAPDSAQVLTYLDQNGLNLAFNTRSTTYPFPIGIDTSKLYADTTYYFSDQIQDIDGTPAPLTVYTLAIDVILWTKAIATHNPAVVQVIQDSLDNYLAEVVNIDGWNPITDSDSLVVDKSALGYITTGDSVRIDGSALSLTTDAITGITLGPSSVSASELATDAVDEIAEQVNDSVWMALLVDYDDVVGSFGDSAQTWGATGAGGSTDSGLVARIGKRLWGIPQGSGSDSLTIVQRTVTPRGGWVDSNKTEQGGIAGANRTWNIYVFDTSGTDVPVPSADVDVQLTNGTVKLRGTTVASGLVTFTVTDGAWVLVSQENGYILNNLSKTISANSTDTVKGYDIIVGAPSSPALCRVFGFVNSVRGVPDDEATVAAFLPAGVARSGNLIISPFSVSTITDSLGYFYLDLIRSDSLIPSGTLYDFIINREDGTIVHKRVTVPNQSSWLLTW